MRTPDTLQKFRVLQPAGPGNPQGWMTFDRRGAEPVGWDVTWEHGDHHIVTDDHAAAQAFADIQDQGVRKYEATHHEPDGSIRVVSNITA